MSWDQLCLRLMLWSLAVAAFLGVTAMFASDSGPVWHLLWTAFATACAAGLLWRLTRLADQPPTRLAGMFGMAAVLFDFLLILLLIWGHELFRMLHERIEDSLAWAAFFVPLTAAPAVGFLAFWHHRTGWLAARAGSVVCVLVFCALMVATFHVGGRNYVPDEIWLGVAGTTALFGLVSVGCLVGAPRQRLWRWAGVVAALGAWLMLCVHVFHETHSRLGQTVFVLLVTLAVVAAYTNLCLMPTLSPIHEIVRRATRVAALVTALLLDALFLGDIHDLYSSDVVDGLTRLASASGIVTACGTVAIFVLTRLRKAQPPPAFVAVSWVEVALTCPSCGHQQKVPLGESACAKCELEFSIRIGERKR